MTQQDVVLITGSSGFIGSALIGKLAGRYRLVGLDRAVSRQRRLRPNASASTSPPRRR